MKTTDTTAMTPRMVRMPDDLWERARQRAREDSISEGRDISVSEWIRRLMEAATAENRL